MGLSKSKSKTTSTASSTPLDQYAPYITQGLDQTKAVTAANQGNLNDMSHSAYGGYNQLAQSAFTPSPAVTSAQAAAQSIYSGNGSGSATYANLQHAGANDPSMGALSHLAQGSTSPGQYDGIGGANPSLSLLGDMSHQQVNGDTSQYYKDAIGGKFLDNNPYVDRITQQATDAATKAQNLRFAGSGMGEGMSTPYAQALGSSVADANNQVRYQNYAAERNLQQQAAGMSDSQYNATQDRSLNAATSLGSQYNQSQGLQLGAQQAKDSAFNADRASMLGAAQSLGGQYNANNAMSLNAANSDMQSQLAAMGQIPGLASAQYAGVNPALSTLGMAASIPYTGSQAYNAGINGLTAKYGNTSGTSTTSSSPSFMDYMMQMGKTAAAFAGG